MDMLCACELGILPAYLKELSKHAGKNRGIKNTCSGSVFLLESRSSPSNTQCLNRRQCLNPGTIAISWRVMDGCEMGMNWQGPPLLMKERKWGKEGRTGNIPESAKGWIWYCLS